jgi:hypothetical protein
MDTHDYPLFELSVIVEIEYIVSETLTFQEVVKVILSCCRFWPGDSQPEQDVEAST